MWLRDEFLARSRVADRDREARESARLHGLLAGECLQSHGVTALAASSRRAIANAFAASGRAAIWVARHIDTGIEVEARQVAR
jgi:hypothetical protein